MTKFTKRLLVSLTFLFLPFLIQTQVTTSSITGTVKNSKNKPLARASIKAIHIPSGSVYNILMQPDGRYTISNMRVGGPYKVEISYVGYNPEVFNDLNLELGTPLNLNAVLVENTKTLSEVTVSGARNFLINNERNGAATQISQVQLQSLPTINRNLDDYTRLVFV